MPRRKKAETIAEGKKRGRKPKVKVQPDTANLTEKFESTPEDKYEPTGVFLQETEVTEADLKKKIETYVFENFDEQLLVKYKYHKRPTRYNALRNVTNEPPLQMNEERYKHWINEKCQRYNPYYNLLDYQMEWGIPERIKELVKYLVVYTKPKHIEKKVYELHISRILCYVAKSVVDKYFYDKMPHINEWLTPADLEHVDLVTAFNEGVNDFCTYVAGKKSNGESEFRRCWSDRELHLPAYNSQWLTKTDRVFRFKIAKSGDSYRTFLGMCLREESSECWKYFNDDHVNAMSDEVDKLAQGKELIGVYKKK